MSIASRSALIVAILAAGAGCSDPYDPSAFPRADAGAARDAHDDASNADTVREDPGDPVDGGCAPAATPAVIVSDERTVVTATAETSSRRTVSGVTVDGTACVRVAISDDGDMWIAGVPEGRFHLVLRNESLALDTSARAIDLGAFVLGRADAQPVCDGDTCGAAFVTLRTDGMEAWADGDTLQMFVPNTGSMARTLETLALAGPPSAGATSLALSFDWRDATRPVLIDASRGDVAWVAELGARGAPPARWQAIARVASFDAIEQTTDRSTPLVGTFAVVDSDQHLAVDLRGAAFAEIAAQVSPKATTQGVALAVRTTPGAAHGLFGEAADLLLAGPVAGDVAFGTLDYGDPYPSTWGTIAVVREELQIRYDDGNAVTASYVDVRPAAEMGAAPIAPRLGPVLRPMLNGADAFTPASGVVPSALAWDAPAIGAPTAYVVTALATKTGTPLARIVTTDTKVALPSGVCAQKACAFEIDAVASAQDLTAQPNRMAPPYTVAPLVTGEVLP